MKIHQEDQINDDRVIGILHLHEIYCQRFEITRSILDVGVAKDMLCTISVSWFSKMEWSRIKSSELAK